MWASCYCIGELRTKVLNGSFLKSNTIFQL